ncbi:MAG TPA: hypothetical protein VFO84_04405 [Dehalococcoidia bacterium]|nr:hypothetical protein [Dehalococcoidia bacterium]
MTLRTLLPALLISFALVAACGGDDDDAETPSEEEPTTEATATSDEPVALVVASSELVVGSNRFIFGLFDAENTPVDGLDATLTLFSDPQNNPTEIGTFDVEFREIEFPNEDQPPDITGVYASQLEFPSAGVYGAQINVAGQNEVPQGLRVLLQVQAEGTGVQVGDQAPASETPTTDEVENLETIDSDDPPNPQFHELSIADALQSGSPTLVSFATPAFCTSRLCGPMVDVLLTIYPEYEGSVNFIQVEPFELDDQGQVVTENGTFKRGQTFNEWGLTSEPVTFLIDPSGTVVYRFESVVTQDELREAIDALLAAA